MGCTCGGSNDYFVLAGGVFPGLNVPLPCVVHTQRLAQHPYALSDTKHIPLALPS